MLLLGTVLYRTHVIVTECRSVNSNILGVGFSAGRFLYSDMSVQCYASCYYFIDLYVSLACGEEANLCSSWHIPNFFYYIGATIWAKFSQHLMKQELRITALGWQ